MKEAWDSSPDTDGEIELSLLLEAIYRKFHYDFRCYSRTSLERRLVEALAHFRCATVSALQDRLLHDPRVFPELMRFLTVQVSDLFRDPLFYLTLRQEIVPFLRTYPSLRIWIAGCSTGEEAYSFAILLEEEGLLDKATLYATDINPESLRISEAGSYPIERLDAFAVNHGLSGGRGPLSKHYTTLSASMRFNDRLRKKILFSDHSLATDAGFAEMQLISCRNVLIYFDRQLQSRVLGIFRDSLCRRGYLGLGSRESVHASSDAYDFAELAERWYQRC